MRLSYFLEKKIRALFQNNRVSCGDVNVRVLSCRDKKVTVCDEMQEYFRNEEVPFPTEFPYRAKAVFVFQKQPDGSEICFFGFEIFRMNLLFLTVS